MTGLATVAARRRATAATYDNPVPFPGALEAGHDVVTWSNIWTGGLSATCHTHTVLWGGAADAVTGSIDAHLRETTPGAAGGGTLPACRPQRQDPTS